MTNCFGDDMTYFNYFNDKNPISFFGFSNLEAMLSYIEAIPRSISESENSNRCAGWHTHNPEWNGTRDMREALSLARNGWAEGIDLATEAMELLQGEHAVQRKRNYTISGGRVNVGRMLSGNPLHMQRKTKQPGKKNITLFVETIMSWKVPADYAIIRAGIVAAIADILEDHGFSCAIVASAVAHCKYREKSAYQIAVKLKDHGEKLNLNDTVFALGHPSFLRRLEFALCATDEALKYEWERMGTPRRTIDSNATEFNISQLPGRLRTDARELKDIMRVLTPYVLRNNKLPIDLAE